MSTSRKRAEATVGVVLIADDHSVFRLGLAGVLRESLGATRVIEADRYQSLLDHLDEPELELVIVDLGLPGPDSPTQLANIRAKRPDVRVVVLSASEDRDDILHALQAGVHGYIVKSERTGKFIERIRYVLDGNVYVPRVLAEAASPEEQKNATKAPAGESKPVLSERQRQVLSGLVEGRSNKEIARNLGVSEGTVKMHVAALFRVLGASNRAHAAALGKSLLD